MWVNVTGGVMFFMNYELDEFKEAFDAFGEDSGVDYWEFFNYFFADCLGSERAYSYSVTWND